MRFQPRIAVAFLFLGRISVEAYPSFGSKVPNGEKVPCLDEDDPSCIGGYCRGLGHGSCAGGVPGNPNLNPFGLDWKANGYEWTTDLCTADSDGDGFTNGEELGDPCCTWVAGVFGGSGDSDYLLNFIPSHPGDPNHIPPAGYQRPACDDSDLATPADAADEDEDSPTGIAAFNPGERQGSFEFRIKDYPIPRETTTYVDFVFNIPDDFDDFGNPDVVHVVFGDALVSQPKHLHHFVIQGCSSRVPEEIEGRPLDSVPDHCNVPVGGFSGWAPGATIWGVPTNAGVAIGKGFGVQAISINVHYTDGDADYLEGKQAIATDGIRVHYTPDLRPNTVTASPIINVGFGPKEMHIEPSKKRAFMTRTCTIESKCQDLADEKMNLLGSMMAGDPELTCASGASQMYCGFSEQFKMACPMSCGLCGKDSPRKVEEYKAISTFYHGHVIAREMYMTLIPKDSNEKIDLKSRSFWHYDDQSGYDLDNVILRPGDKIQTTCVYDSSERNSITRFDLATYDEMCLNTITTLMPLPEVEEGGLSMANEIDIRGFRCATSEAGDIWLGHLSPEEDPRDIMNLHPLKDQECSFPTGIFTFSGVPTQEMRCNGSIVKSDEGLCSDIDGSFLMPVINAGYSCQGGSFNTKDSNDGTTEEQCVSGGGVWTAYNCGEAEEFLLNSPIANDPEVRHFLKEYWWQPKCCIGGTQEDGSADTEADDMLSSQGKDSTDKSGGNIGAIVGGVIGGLAMAAIIVALVVKKMRQSGHVSDSVKSGKRNASIAATRRVTGYDFDTTI